MSRRRKPLIRVPLRPPRLARSPRPTRPRRAPSLLTPILILSTVSTAAAAPADAARASADSTESRCFRAIPEWRTPEEFLLAEPVTARVAFGLLVDASLEDRLAGAARAELRGRLGLDEIVLGRGGLRFRKDYGERLTIRTTAGLGTAAEDALRAEYRLWRSWYVRSEARERGETTLEFRREIRFW